MSTNKSIKYSGWKSGWCGPHPFDPTAPPESLTSHSRCNHVAINGERAATPYVICVCECHDGAELPDLSAYDSRLIPVESDPATTADAVESLASGVAA